MEKLRKPGTRTSRSRLLLLLSVACIILLVILGPVLLYVHSNSSSLPFLRHHEEDRQSTKRLDNKGGDGESDYKNETADIHIHPRNSSAIGVEEEEERRNELFGFSKEEESSSFSSSKLRRELIHIFKLPPVSDADFEAEELRHRLKTGGVWFFDDLDTDSDDYLTNDKKATSKSQQSLPHNHRFSTKPLLPVVISQNSSNSSSSLPLRPSRLAKLSGNRYYNTGHFRAPHAVVWDPHPQYVFHAFGHRFHLLLQVLTTTTTEGDSSSFLTPHLSFATHSSSSNNNKTNSSSSGSDEVWVSRENLRGRINGCFYTGFLLGDPASSVAVSLCHGMTGHIRSSHGSFFIEPLRPSVSPKKKEEGDEGPHFKDEKPELELGNSDPLEHEELVHEIYQVGLNVPDVIKSSHDNDKEEEEEGSYSYDAFDNLQLGLDSSSSSVAIYEDDDEDDAAWLNPGGNKNVSVKKKRSKRSMSSERYVELSVVTDASMSAYHGGNLRHYVLTLLSIVALIYKDASIGNPVNIALVSFHVLPEKSFANSKGWSENVTLSGESLPGISASEMLRNFCKWQKEHNVVDDKSPAHHDTALLLTRETICRNPWLHKCDTLGLAELGTMCDAYASCAIVQDNGLSAAFTIAHELGHVMNMPHDDDYKCQSFHEAAAEGQGIHHLRQASSSDAGGGGNGGNNGGGGHGQHYVMSRMLDHNTYPWAWSRCSRHFLTEFLDANHGECLEDKPGSNLLNGGGRGGREDTDDNDDENSIEGSSGSRGPGGHPKQPGQIFSEHKQCELVFGPSSQLCSYMPSCKRLWCTTGTTTEEQEGCRTQHMPWADGTPCGSGGRDWCQRGACVKKDLEKLRIVNGGWGPWLDFGDCSRSCGGGVRKSFRECDSPRPSNGGKYCVGPRVRYESCHTHECPHSTDSRGDQCSSFNNDNFNIQGLPKELSWVPKYHGISAKDRCKLFCRVSGSSSYYLLREKVVDGTPCGVDTFDICVNGACLPAGCDRRLYSKKTLDICGVCGGDGGSCRTTRGSFNESRYGYNAVVKIPAGASNIDIRQHSHDQTARDDNYLSLQDSVEEYLLNGHFVVSMFRKTLHYGGSILEYSGSDEVVERINSSSRPIKSDLYLQVLSVGKLNPPDIVYQYVISLDTPSGTNTPNEGGVWTLSSDRWTTCSSICEGSQSALLTCTNVNGGSELAPESCREARRPEDVRRQCNSHCSLRWSRVQGPCDCASPNRTEVSLKCVRETLGGHNRTYIADGYCSKLGSGRPSLSPDCGEECSRPKWRTTQWSECNVRCGEGVQVRSVWCQQFHEGRSYENLGDSACGPAASKPSSRRKCDNGACGSWKIDQWSPCSSQCGPGVSRAAYGCYLGESILPSDYCAHVAKPPLERVCEAEVPCVEWAIGPSLLTEFGEEDGWSGCSSKCVPSSGKRTRSVVCVMKGKKRVQVNEDVCGRFVGGKPASAKACPPNIPSDCGMPLPVSTKRSFFRSIVPGASRALSLPLIGSGGDKNSIDDEWEVEAWGPCFRSGSSAVQVREVTCKVRSCRGNRPTTSRACGVWFTGEWGGCNATCASKSRLGTEVREVTCVLSEEEGGSLLEEEDCLPPKPERGRVCSIYCKTNKSSRGRWRTGAWGPCSRPCGGLVVEGQRVRQVACVDETRSQSILEDKECDPRTRPEGSSSCMDGESGQPCPVWSVSPWSECMATATAFSKASSRGGGSRQALRKKADACSNEILQEVPGHRERVVRCTDANGREVPESSCHFLMNRPEGSQSCILSRKACAPRGSGSSGHTFRWRVGNWTSCSKNCGTKGVKTRGVECVRMDKGTVVEDKSCGKLRRKPKGERGCARFHCPYRWVTTDWSECSRSCGYGFQKRGVSCHKVNRLGWVDPDQSASGCEGMEKPKEYNYCLISESCDGGNSTTFSWKTEAWSPCPTETPCGSGGKKGVQRRRVYCSVNGGARTPQRHCEKLDPKPVKKRKCPRIPCGHTSCGDVRKAGYFLDGEYSLSVGGTNASIFCYGMSGEEPKEYLTLPRESISEIYDKRLIRPETCPRNGRRTESCECVQDANRRSGLTTWRRLRINVTNLRVDTSDFTFATSTGDLIPFGTSGDCYSSAMNCAQGRFSIDLRGTPLAVSSLTSWVSHGHKPTMQITKSSGHQKVEGKCGGFCGTCAPNRAVGLKLDVTL